MIWTKPSGDKIETNDKPATVEYCESLGWKKTRTKKVAIPKPGKE